MSSLKNTLLKMAGQQNTITVHRPFVDFTGSLEAGMMLSQLLYWSDRSESGWVAKSDDEFAEELCLTKYRVRKARKRMEEAGYLNTEVRKFKNTPTLHYQLNLIALESAWSDFAKSESPPCENAKSMDSSKSESPLTETTRDHKQREGAREEEPPFAPEPPPEEQPPTDPVDECPLIAAFANVVGQKPKHEVRTRLMKAWSRGEIRDVQLFAQVLKNDLDGHDNPKMYRGGGFAVLKRKYRQAAERKREQKQRRAERGGGTVEGQALPGEAMTHSQAVAYWQDELGSSGDLKQHFRIEQQENGPAKFYLKEVPA